jgi:hypothetical protein
MTEHIDEAEYNCAFCAGVYFTSGSVTKHMAECAAHKLMKRNESNYWTWVAALTAEQRSAKRVEALHKLAAMRPRFVMGYKQRNEQLEEIPANCDLTTTKGSIIEKVKKKIPSERIS